MWYPEPRRCLRQRDKRKGCNDDRTVLVLEGAVERTVIRSGLSARLSDAQTGIMRWADVFDRDISNLLAVEDEIAEKIVEAVAPRTAPKMDSFERATPSLSPSFTSVTSVRSTTSRRGGRSQSCVQSSRYRQSRSSSRCLHRLSRRCLRPTQCFRSTLRMRAIPFVGLLLLRRTRRFPAMARWPTHTRRAQLHMMRAGTGRQRPPTFDARSQLTHGTRRRISGTASICDNRKPERCREGASYGDTARSNVGDHGRIARVCSGACRKGPEAVIQAQTAVAMDPSFATHHMYGALLIYSGNPKVHCAARRGAPAESGFSNRARLVGTGSGFCGRDAAGQTRCAGLSRRRRGTAVNPQLPGSDRLGDVDGGFAALQRALELHDPFFNSDPLTSPPFNKVRNDPGLLR